MLEQVPSADSVLYSEENIGGVSSPPASASSRPLERPTTESPRFRALLMSTKDHQ
jgi:hypothetical protein